MGPYLRKYKYFVKYTCIDEMWYIVLGFER